MVNLKINLEPNADGNHVFYTDEVLRGMNFILYSLLNNFLYFLFAGEVELSLSSPKSFRGKIFFHLNQKFNSFKS